MDKHKILSYILILSGFIITIYYEFIKITTLEDIQYFVYGFLASMLIGVGINLHDNETNKRTNTRN